MASRDKGLHSSPPVPSMSPLGLQGTTDMGLLGISSFRDMPASLFVSSVCSVCSCCAALAHAHTHPESQTRPANSLKHPLSHISEHSYHQDPLHIFPNSNSCSESPQVAYKNSRSPHNVATAGCRPAFYRKDIVSHILPCPHHRLPCLPWPLPRKKQTSPSSPPTMSPVEHDYPPREVHRPNTDRHAAEHSYIEALPSAAAGRVHIYTTNSPSHSRASSSDSFRSNTYAAMDDQVMIPTKPSQHGCQQPEEQAPVLPQKSALRASRLLDNLVGLKLTMPDPPSFTQTPHDEYMSSEEDASSTAGDFSDFEYDSSSDDVCPSPAKERRSHEVTARVVSVIFSGKPSVVDVPQNRRSISPTSFERRQSIMDLATQTLTQEDTETKRRRMSVTSTSSDSVSTKPARTAHPPRSSSMQPIATHNTIKKTKPAFLQIDPYANGSVYSLDVLQEPKEVEQEDDRPRTPKTPTKMFKGVARTLSLMKRRSTPRMNQAFLSPSTENAPLATSPSKRSILGEPLCEAPQEMSQEAIEETADFAVPPPPQRPPPRPQSASPVTYDEIVRVAKRNERMERNNEKLLSVARTPTGDLAESPISPMSPLSATSTNTTATTGKRMSSFNAARRRMSIKLTGKLQL